MESSLQIGHLQILLLNPKTYPNNLRNIERLNISPNFLSKKIWKQLLGGKLFLEADSHISHMWIILEYSI